MDSGKLFDMACVLDSRYGDDPEFYTNAEIAIIEKEVRSQALEAAAGEYGNPLTEAFKSLSLRSLSIKAIYDEALEQVSYEASLSNISYFPGVTVAGT